jgi:hypothetical protein
MTSFSYLPPKLVRGNHATTLRRPPRANYVLVLDLSPTWQARNDDAALRVVKQTRLKTLSPGTDALVED